MLFRPEGTEKLLDPNLAKLEHLAQLLCEAGPQGHHRVAFGQERAAGT